MIDYRDIEAKLDEYSEAFDIYMEGGEMPPTVSPDDCLAEYMQEVIDSNPQIDGSDQMWIDVLKEGLLAFFSAMLEHFREMQLEAMAELALIDRFAQSSREGRGRMWQEVKVAIEGRYSQEEIHLHGFERQLQEGGDADAIASALASDWKEACLSRLDQQERQLLERNKAHVEKALQEAGALDYEDRKRVEAYIHSYTQLREIVDMIGRDRDSTKEEQDTVIYKFMPVTVARNSSVEEVDRIESGDKLERVLPTELSMPEDLFYKRYVAKELQLFASQGKDKPRKTEEHRRDPRLKKGPIVVSIDTSGSMLGKPQEIAFSLLKQLVSMARKQGRPCYLISFSVRAKAVDLAKPRNWRLLDHFLENSFSGGTDGEAMLGEAIRVLQSGAYEMADVLIVSDLQFAEPRDETPRKIAREQGLGTRFYALQIGDYNHDYGAILDRIWQV